MISFPVILIWSRFKKDFEVFIHICLNLIGPMMWANTIFALIIIYY